MSEKLLPCPFCGCEAKYHNGYPPYDKCHFIDCAQCDVSTPILSTKLDVAAVWNQRAQPAGEAEPIAWGAFRVGGDRDGQLYAYCNTKHEIETYITQVHQASDNITLRDAPLYAAPPAAANQAGMWQPIETAPKDGTYVLLATPKGRIADGNYEQRYGVWSWPYLMANPTHWMPLPAAPHPTESHALGGGDE